MAYGITNGIKWPTLIPFSANFLRPVGQFKAQKRRHFLFLRNTPLLMLALKLSLPSCSANSPVVLQSDPEQIPTVAVLWFMVFLWFMSQTFDTCFVEMKNNNIRLINSYKFSNFCDLQTQRREGKQGSGR